MAATNDPDLSRAPWRKSSYSGNGSNCVEVAAATGGRVAAREAMDRDGATEILSRQAWQRFTAPVKGGDI